jgi:hypothetical protein
LLNSRTREPSLVSSSSSNKQADYNEYNANQESQKQAQYNEANTLQTNNEKTQKQMLSNTENTINNNMGESNWNGGSGGGGVGGSNNYYYGGGGGNSAASTGEVAGAAALGAIGGMAVGSMVTANSQPKTTVIENNPVRILSTSSPAYGISTVLQ